MLVELMVPTDPGNILRVPEAGAPWHVDEPASSSAHPMNDAVFTEKVTSTSWPQRIATFKHFSNWHSKGTASALEKVFGGSL